jgi:hypothetical protein
MPDIDMQETGSEEHDPASEEYAIRIQVTPTGYTISTDGSESVEASTSTDMLKAVLSIVQANPLAEDPAQQLEAGYKSA